MAGLARQHAYVPGQSLAHRLRVAHAEQAAQASLPGTSSPRLRQNRGRNRRDDLLGQVTGVQRPHLTVVAFRRDQRTGIVGDPAHRG